MKCGCCILFLKDFLFTFFKTAGKDVTLRQNMMVREREKINYLKLPVRNQKKENESAIALIAYEDISDGGGVYYI